jgi:ribonuclease HI
MEPLVYIHADESCLGIQFTDRDSPGGAGALLEFWRDDIWIRSDIWLSEPATTNNRMALRGAAQALDALRKPARVVFVSDSQYLIKGMREWVHAWARKGWRRKTGAVENVELWRALVHASARHQVDWRWVRGHAGHPRNEYANFLATRAARNQDDSNGSVSSGFVVWLEEQREKYQRYLDFHEWLEPPADVFTPVRVPEEGSG